MERFVGVDLHKSTFSVCILDSDGKIESEGKYATCASGLESFRSSLRSSDTVAFEVSTVAWGFYDAISTRVGRVIVANPAKTRLLASGDPKTDALDARRLAQLSQDKHIAEVWVPDMRTRQMRELVRFQMQLTNISTKMSNIDFSRGLVGSIAGVSPACKGAGVVDEGLLGECSRAVAEAAKEQKRRLDAVFTELAVSDARAMLLMRHAGVGPYVAIVVLAAAGDISRFEDAKGFASYTGLVPRVYASGESSYCGRITKAGRKELRYALVQAAWSAIRSEPELKSDFDRIAKARGEAKAIVAVARKLAVRLYHLLKDGTCDGMMSDEAYARKLSRLLRGSGVHVETAACGQALEPKDSPKSDASSTSKPAKANPKKLVQRVRNTKKNAKGEALSP
jgi:transposase